MNLLFWTTQLFLITSLLSCSHVQTENTAGFTDEQKDQMNREALTIASERLGQMVVQAKENKEATTFLSTDLFLKGNMSLMEGDYATAAILFKHLVELVPGDDFIQKKYAVSLIKLGDIEASEPVLETLYSKSHEEKVGLILAGVYTGLDKEDKARELYQTILKKNPKSEDACVFLGKSFAIAKNTTKAINLLSECARRDPKNGMYDYYIGKIHVDNGHLKKGVVSFKKAHERQPSLNQAVTALGIIYEESEQHEAAIAIYRKHLKLKPSDSSVLSRIVQVLFLKERYDEVIPYAEKLSDLEPENLNLKVKLGILYTDANKYAEAISVFKELLSFAPQSDKILYYLGAIHQEKAEYEESIKYFNSIPESSGLYTDSSIQIATMLSTLAAADLKFKEPFLAHVNLCLEKFKDLRVEFSVIKSGYFESLGLLKEAMEAMMVAQEEKGFSTQHKYYLANLFEKEKRFEESTALIMGIIEAEPKNAHAWNFLGYAMLVRGVEMEKAFEYIQTALKISPDDGYIRDSLGWYYFKKGELKLALNELELALKQIPDDFEILKHLAEIHKELRNFPKARTFLESALKHARYPGEREEILVTLEELEKDRLPASRQID
ncbi:MAG TPA: tetratricopeptide repeat protein [Bacteriovoracaceae bacterium]|nr:tetratricopeptide repeat protein [Bacteriovoracaceae bacterium]